MPTKPGFVTRFYKARGFTVTSSFGPRPNPLDPATTDFHAGIDYARPRGTPVETPAEGVIFAARMYTGWGNLVSVTDSRGYNHLFAHLDAIRVSPGQRVFRGTVIGTVGSTGWATGPHLHYQINRPGTRVRGDGYFGNPDDYIFDDEVVRVEKAIVLGGDADFFNAAPLANRLNCPVFVREALGSLKLVKEVFICGGTEEEIRSAAPSAGIVNLSGRDRFETAAQIRDYINKKL